MGCHIFTLTNSYFSRWLKHVKTTNQFYKICSNDGYVKLSNDDGYHFLVGGLEHVLFSISYMGCHIFTLTNSYFSRWLKHVKTTNQFYKICSNDGYVKLSNDDGYHFLVGGLEHVLFSISYMGCHIFTCFSNGNVNRWSSPTRTMPRTRLKVPWRPWISWWRLGTTHFRKPPYIHRHAYTSYIYIYILYTHIIYTHYIYYWLVLWNHGILLFHVLGMSSSQLTFTPSFFQRRRSTTNQLLVSSRRKPSLSECCFNGYLWCIWIY